MLPSVVVFFGCFLIFGTGRSLAERGTPFWVIRAVRLSGVFSALWGACRLVAIVPLAVTEDLALLIQRAGSYAGGGFIGVWLLIVVSGELRAMFSTQTKQTE